MHPNHVGALVFALWVGAASAAEPAWKDARTLQLTGAKVIISEPVLVSRSPGFLWFPTLMRLGNGDLLAMMNDCPDQHQKEVTAKVAWSGDGGLTWSKPKAALYSDAYVRRTDGDVVLLPSYLFPKGDGVLAAPYQIAPKGKQELNVMKEGLTVTGWPRPDRSFEPKLGLGGFMFCGQTVPLPDGGHLAHLYGYFKDTQRYSLVAAESRDGVKWKIRSVVADEKCKLPGVEGPCESALCRIKDGRLMTVFRLEPNRPYGQAWSDDDGKTWTEPVPIKGPSSVMPSLAVMKNGTVVLSGGRAGLSAWFNLDGLGKDWQRIDVQSIHNATRPTESIEKVDHTSSYTEVVPLDDAHLLYIYDRIPNGWNAIPKGSPLTNSVWVVRLTLHRTKE